MTRDAISARNTEIHRGDTSGSGVLRFDQIGNRPPSRKSSSRVSRPHSPRRQLTAVGSLGIVWRREMKRRSFRQTCFSKESYQRRRPYNREVAVGLRQADREVRPVRRLD